MLYQPPIIVRLPSLPSTPDGGESRLRGRRGAAALWTLGLMLIASSLAISLIEIYRLQTARVEMQNAAEAAALAAARELVDDRLLVGDPRVIGERTDAARSSACRLAFNNGVFGDPVALDRNDANDGRGEVVLGRLDPHADDVFYGENLSAAGQTSAVGAGLPRPCINACHVRACRTRSHGASVSRRLAKALGVPSANVAAEATALLDRDVIGFRPDGVRPIPLVPIALLSDPQGAKEESWENRVEKGAGPDEYRFDLVRQTVQSGSDGLHEMGVAFRDDRRPDNACVLRLGGAGLVRHVGASAAWADGPGNGQTARRSDRPRRRWTIPGARLYSAPQRRQGDLKALFDALGRLRDRGELRVWPLYQTLDQATGDAIITDFVAARVVRAEEVDDHQFELVVQPCMMTAASAVTDASRRRADRPEGNKYICKIRIVQ